MARKKTHEQFMSEVYAKVGDEYTILSEYHGVHNKVKMRHNVCEHTWNVSSNSFLSGGSRCPKCAKEKLRKTQDEFVKQLYDLVGNEYILNDNYINYKTKINLTHTICGNDYFISPEDFLSGGNRCRICNVKKRTKTHEKFVQEVFDLTGNEYEVLGQYKTTNIKLRMKHIFCNYEWEMRPVDFLSGRRCPKCFGNIRRTTDSYKEEIYQLVQNEYEVLGEYKNVDTYIEMRHISCGSKFDVTPYSFLSNGSRCPRCNRNMRINTDIFKSIIFDLVGTDYELLSEYIKDSSHVTMRHNICNHIYQVTPSNFLRGRRCPNCKSSKGEQKVRKWLENREIIFVSQMEYDGLIGLGGGNLSYDFYLPDHNLLIEYQGEFHDGTAYQQTKEEFEIQIEHDRRKREYSLSNDIELLEIWYWDFDRIEEILNSYLI